MNKLLIPNGGMPFEGDDLLYLQEGLRSGFAMLSNWLTSASGFTDQSCIIRGVNLSYGSGNITYSEGTVYIAGELCMLSGGVATGADGFESEWWIELETFADPAGTQIFADAVSKDTYQTRRAKVTNSPSIPSDGAMRFDLLDKYKINTVWLPPPLLSGFTADHPIQIRKNLNLISFKGALHADGSTPNNATAFQLPEYLRPTHTRVYVVSSGTPYPPLYVTVQADGYVIVSRVEVDDPIPFLGSIYLDSIHYVLN